MPKLIKGARTAYDWLSKRKAGDIVTLAEILAATNWQESAIKTYISKNKLSPFILPLADKKYKILMDGAKISEDYFHEVFTQTAPKKVILSVGDALNGNSYQYSLVEPLGNGAVGHVWSAKVIDSKPTRYVAVKIMLPRPDLLAESRLTNVRERFRQETENGLLLANSSVVKYLDKGDCEGNPFLVMEQAERSIGSDLRKNGAFELQDAKDVIVSCIDGLQYLESRGACHRDIKPDNILRFKDSYKLGDLGIVKWGDLDAAFTGAGTITRASVQLGSWFYMAPEQQNDAHEANITSDIYALGISFIEMLTNSVPPPHAIGAGAFPSPSSDPKIEEIVRRMVKYSPSDRPSLAEIRQVLT